MVKPVLVVLSCAASTAFANEIFRNDVGRDTLGGAGYAGHSFTMPAGDAFQNITWSWIASDGVTLLAEGNLFLLSQEYLGEPSDLSETTPGYLAESTGIESDAYVFASSVILNPSTQYWVYMGGESTFVGGGFTFTDPFAGGQAYERFASPNYFNNGANLDFNFVMNGDVVPAPASLAVLGGISLVAGRRRARA